MAKIHDIKHLRIPTGTSWTRNSERSQRVV